VASQFSVDSPIPNFTQRSVQHFLSNCVYGQAGQFWQGVPQGHTHPQLHYQHTGAAPVQNCTNTKHNKLCSHYISVMLKSMAMTVSYWKSAKK